MPTAKTVQGWRDATSTNFRFVIKASQQITHSQRLTVPSDALSYLTSAVSELGGRLALVAYQLPPFFKCDIARLHSFLEVLPANIMSGFEFRHPSWFVPDVYDLLRRYRAILCFHDSDEGCSPMELTADAVYVRLRRSVYTPDERKAWRARWKTWAASGVEVFAYVKHKDNPDAPRIALEFASGL
jgi:uncharacterized protein YecE (DUF72 family)